MQTIWLINILSVFVLCVFFSRFVILQILLIAFRKRLFDEPDERKIHQDAIPRLGGIAFKVVLFFTFALLLALNMSLGYSELLDGIRLEALPLAYVFCAVCLAHIVGLGDDLTGVRYRAKFLVQIICGVMLVAGGIVLSDLQGMLFIHTLPMWISIPLSILATVFIINAINLIDGIDGLASGLCMVAYFFYGIFFLIHQQQIYAMISFASLGMLIPFYYYNVFGKANRGRKIFMGDTGSMTMGVLLCFLSFRFTHLKEIEPLIQSNANLFVLAFSPLLIPCFDVLRVFLFRIRHGKNPFLPDRNHIHHNLMATGLSAHQTMVILIVGSVLLTILNVVLCCHLSATVLLCINIALWILFDRLIAAKMK